MSLPKKRRTSEKEPTVYQNTPDGLCPALSSEEQVCLHPVTRFALQKPHIEQGGDDWLFVRRFALTASTCADATHCANIFFAKCRARKLCRHELIEKLMLRKSALLEPFEGNDATRHGQLNEPVAVKSFVSEQQTDVFLVGLLMHSEHAWLGASPDGICSDGSLLEVKVPKSRSFKVGDCVPANYWVQCQIQMQVTGADTVHYYEYRVPSTSKRARIKEPRINHQIVKRDDDWYRCALPMLKAFVVATHRLRQLSRLYRSRWLVREQQLAKVVPMATQRLSPLSLQKQ